MTKVDWVLYVITDTLLARVRSREEVVAAAIAGGATVIQLREKAMSTRALVVAGRRLRALTRREEVTFIVNDRLDVGTGNVWEVPGYRIGMSPFGGLKDSGLGYKEGVLEAMKSYTNVKTYSLPWV